MRSQEEELSSPLGVGTGKPPAQRTASLPRHHELYVAHHPTVDQRLHQHPAERVAHAVSHHRHHALLLRGLDDLGTLRGIQAHRLLDKQVLARLDHRGRHIFQVAVRHRDHHRVHVRAPDQRLSTVAHLLDSKLARQLLGCLGVDIGTRDELCVGDTGERRCQVAAAVSAAARESNP